MQPSPTPPFTRTSSAVASRGSLWRGFVSGLIPLAPLVVIVIGALALARLARLLTGDLGFDAQQWAAGVIIALGLLGAAASYVVTCRRALRRVKRWQQAGEFGQANGALWGLCLVALLVLLPVLLAIVIPQHPAPTLAP